MKMNKPLRNTEVLRKLIEIKKLVELFVRDDNNKVRVINELNYLIDNI